MFLPSLLLGRLIRGSFSQGATAKGDSTGGAGKGGEVGAVEPSEALSGTVRERANAPVMTRLNDFLNLYEFACDVALVAFFDAAIFLLVGPATEADNRTRIALMVAVNMTQGI